ncbi:MAG: RHS repeat-associated core domain-containing protein, partial [Verrucomicrobia bacterium]|nr:RHS repeat-associated core domain-containing protein [Verrucomicrobiota bacterium]
MFQLINSTTPPPVAGRKEGKTTVTCSDGSSIVYHFSKNLLITCIQNYDQHRNLKKEKLFLWNANQWLEAIEERDADHNLLYQKSYEYDPFGNPITEKFSGDITGDGGLQTYITKRTFSQDGKNLLFTEEAQNGKTICYTYLPSTNLITSKLTKHRDRILLREFYLYDDCHNLVQKISDDGFSEDMEDLSHVTQRRITTYLLRSSEPFLHMAEWIIETYLEAGSERLLRKTQLIYDSYGHVAEEIVYDSQSNHAYTLFKTYNERGDVLSETNSIGQQASYTYDAKARKVTAQNFSQRLLTAFSYDTLGRLKERKEAADDQSVRITRSEYDPQNRLIQTTDRFGNSTFYSYDHLSSSPSKTIYPPIVSDKGEAVSVITNVSHDPLGRELTKTDANGNTTAYRYNAYGSPTEILHPDGATETFRYTLDGTLDRYTDPDGLTIQYQHDILGRVLSKTYLVEPLVEETYTYNGFNLVAYTDKEGNLTQYFYDGAGRKIGEEFCGRKVEYTYDPLGRLQSTIRHNQENTLVIHYQRDLLGRILEETKTDSEKNLLYQISYSYDADGNVATITRPVNGQDAIETITYDPFAREICRIDALGHPTITHYDETQVNAIGQRILQVAAIDPLNRTAMQTYDALARPACHHVTNSSGRTLSLQEKTYDPHGNLIFIHEHVYQQGQHLETQSTHYAYNNRNQLDTLMRAYNTPEARKTGYTYYPSGKTRTKTLPNRTTLSYAYDPFGHLSTLRSSDAAIDHAFEHNRLGHLLRASDRVNDLFIQRKVDPFGNTLEESFPCGFQICKAYDDFNRCFSLKTPFAEIVYRYDPLHLRSVEKADPHGKLLYTHSYAAYDLSNHLLREELIGDLGEVVHSSNLLGQTLSLTSPYYAEDCIYDAVGNTLSRCINGKESIYTYDGLDQLASENNEHYAFDSLYNRREAHGRSFSYNLLNELLGPFRYDLNGNLQSKEQLNCIYDPLNQLIEARTPTLKVNFVYDPLGRRLSKTVSEPTPLGWKEVLHEHYLYDGSQEIGSLSAEGDLQNFRTLGLAASTVCIEIDGKPYAPIVDVQGNICSLIDPRTRAMTSSYAFTAFGETLKATQDQNPCRFASKRLDPELNLIYFGKRYYDPSLGRWTSPDPMGFADSMNLYQYVLNNPFSYTDPDGQFIIAIPLLALTWKVVAAAAVAVIVGYELEHQFGHSHSDLGKALGAAVGQMAKGSLGLA